MVVAAVTTLLAAVAARPGTGAADPEARGDAARGSSRGTRPRPRLDLGAAARSQSPLQRLTRSAPAHPAETVRYERARPQPYRHRPPALGHLGATARGM